MVGQGSPPIRHDAPQLATNITSCVRCCALLGVIFLSVATGWAAEDDLDLQLRISWGGGIARVWSGSISLSSGTLEKGASLGMEADTPGTILPTNEQTLLVLPRTPNSFGGVDVHVQAPREAVLKLQLQAGDDSQPQLLEAKLADLVRGKITKPLDAKGNRLAVQRVASDTLRVSCERKHWVFRTGEEWQCRITPHLCEEAANSTTTLTVSLRSLASNAVVFQDEQAIPLDAAGTGLKSIAMKATLATEGVYELSAELRTRPLVAPIVRPKVLLTRRLQCVALDAQAAISPANVEWKAIEELDPTNIKSGDHGLHWPSLKLGGSNHKGPLGSEPVEVIEHLGARWSSLRAAGWQAYPLAIQQTQQPHILEIEFPSDVSQTLGISLVEPNSAGQLVPLGLDSGIDVSDGVAGRTPTLEKHRLVFWPRTKSPLVLLTNRRQDRPAVFGKIRVLAGPATLPSQVANHPLPLDQQRLLAAYYERPLFPENFSVAEAVDSRSSRTYDDWSVFFHGTKRLTEYLKYAGLNSVVLPVNSEGSSLYPSELLDPTPKYESGAYSETGPDSSRKDVLELLLREFDRQGLVCIPALSFTSPLPELEELKATLPEREAVGLELVGADGRTWLQTNTPRRGQAPYYNLLDPRVQEAMRRIVLEIANRYQSHAAFGGLAIHLSGDGYAQLPDETWCLDETTLARFARDTKTVLPPVDSQHPEARWQWVQKEARTAWLAWRAEKVAEFYRHLRSDLHLFRPDLKLILCPLEPIHSRRLEQRLRPTLPAREQMQEGFLAMGLDPARLAQIPGVTFARAWRDFPTPGLGTDAIQTELNDSSTLDTSAAAFAKPATIMLTEPLPLRLEAFDKAQPFGPQNTNTFFLTHTTPLGITARKRYTQSLAAVDSHLLGVGGWMLPLGQEHVVRPLLETIRRIPAEKFENVAPTAEMRTQPVVLRRWSGMGHTWFYLVNPSAWPAIVDLEFNSKIPLRLHAVNAESPSVPLPVAQGVVRWRVRLEPFDVAAAKLEQANVEIASWRTQVDSSVELALKEQIRDVRLRANNLRSPLPLPEVKNVGFEEANPEHGVLGWYAATGPGVMVDVDRRMARSGSSSLHVVSRSVAAQTPSPVVWVRSHTITSPSTGRLALWVWLRTRDAKQQPTLRLAVEGKLAGKPYYRRANVGASEDGRPVQPLREEWSPFLFPLDDLPAEGLTDLQVGFDLMSEGEIWVDDVQVYNLWFQETERDALLKSIAVADFQLQAGRVRDCTRFLDSYWPQFLRRHVAMNVERVAERPAAPVTTPALPAKPAPMAKDKPVGKDDKQEIGPTASPSMLERLRQWTPRLPFQ